MRVSLSTGYCRSLRVHFVLCPEQSNKIDGVPTQGIYSTMFLFQILSGSQILQYSNINRVLSPPPPPPPPHGGQAGIASTIFIRLNAALNHNIT